METEYPLSAAMKSVIADAYKVFGRYKAQASLDVCTGCCMEPKMALEMSRLPLAKLTRGHFYGYNDSAKSEIQPAEELCYLLPRMLELMAQGAEIHHSTELFMDRVGRCPAGSFNASEQQVLNRFAQVYFLDELDRNGRWGHEPLAVLLMFYKGGQPIAPLLDAWLSDERPASTVKFVRETYWEFWTGKTYSNAFGAECQEFNEQLHDWMMDPQHRQRFAEKIMHADFLRMAASEADQCNLPFSLMVDAVFDELTA